MLEGGFTFFKSRSITGCKRNKFIVAQKNYIECNFVDI